MSKANLVDFTKSIFSPKSSRSLERAALPNPLVVGFIFTVMFIMAMVFILL
jgi:hypothetical protein